MPKEVEESVPSIGEHADRLSSILDSAGDHHSGHTEEHRVSQPEHGGGGLVKTVFHCGSDYTAG